MITRTISHESTGAFSQLVTDYLAQKEDLKPFYKYNPDREGISSAIAERKKFPVDRATLVSVLKEQYQDYDLSESFQKQLQSLASENTFTVCTAHQPDLMTGYLYFFYKIIHAAKLADTLKQQFPEYHFVPVFYIGSEDNDIDELSVFHYEGKTYRWNTQQTGAVGRMSTKDLQPLIKELNENLIPPGKNKETLAAIIAEAYDGKKTIAQAIRHLVHTFLEGFGVVVLDADNDRLKSLYRPIMKQELLQPVAGKMVREVSEKLQEKYKAQAYARDINLFYLKDNLRERIEKNGETWRVVNTNISWESEAEILTELESHPERFSPNVILRGLYQECILPDVAFIGGGSEVAYWMQLKTVFEHYDTFFPTLVLRQSALWMQEKACSLQRKLHLSDEDIFLPTDALQKQYTLENFGDELDLSSVLNDLQEALDKIKHKAEAIDITLSGAAKSVKAKTSHLTHRLEQKMIRAKKRQLSDRMRQITQLKDLLFPLGTLQERYDSFLELYLLFGKEFFKRQYDATLPWGTRFLIVREETE